MLTPRLEAMDAQRYDLSKSFKHEVSINFYFVFIQLTFWQSRSSLSIITEASSGHSNGTQDMTASNPWTGYAITPCNSPASSLTDISSSLNQQSLTGSCPITPPPEVSTISLPLEGSAAHGGKEEEYFTSSCTIIRPMPRSPISEFFSRPSSPFSRPSSPTSRPSSPIIFSTLNCFGSTDAFEDEVDYLQAQRSKELEGHSAIRIHVEQETVVYTEERWRDAVQVLLYGSPIAVERAQVSVNRD